MNCPKPNWSAIAADVARALLGDENRKESTRRELRFGRKGSLSVDLSKAVWFDNEAQEGGGLLDLIEREAGTDRAGAWEWLAAHGFAEPANDNRRTASTPPRRTRKARPANDNEPNADTVKKSALAARQWREARRIEGTPGARYLRRRGLSRWPGPSAIRWSKAFEAWPGDPNPRPALLFSFRDRLGAVVAVQAVRVTHDGRKIEGRAKTSLGPVGSGVCVLPGRGDLHIAEGPETALSVREATGNPVMISVGPISAARIEAAPVPPSGAVAICADAHPAHLPDGKPHPVARALSGAIEAAHARGLAVRVAVPAGADAEGRDFNDMHRADGREAVRAAIKAATWQAPPAWGTATAAAPSGTVEDARARVAEAFGAWAGAVPAFWRDHAASDPDNPPEPPVSAVRVSTGIGKSYTARRAAVDLVRRLRAEGDARAVVIAVPRHNLAGEYLDALRVLAGDLRIASWRGRASDNPAADGETMCNRAAEAGELSRAGVDVDRHLCRRKLPDGTEAQCPFFEGCAYLRQRRAAADIWLVQHAMIWRKPPAAIDPAALIVDEDATEGATGTPDRLSLNDIRRPLLIGDDDVATADLHAICARVANAIAGQRGPVDLAKIRASVTAEDLTEARRLALRAKAEPAFHPGATPREIAEELRRIVPNNRRALRLAKLLAILRAAIEAGHETAPGLAMLTVETKEGDTFEAVRMRAGRKVSEGWAVPSLLASATAHPVILREVWPALGDVIEAAASAPFVRVRQITDRQFGAASVCPDPDKSGPETLRHAASTRARLRRYIEARAAALGGRVLVVCQKAAEELLRDEGLPGNVETAHFGNLDGLDRWRDVRGLIVIGRPLPRPSEVEDAAEALTARPVERLAGWYDAAPGWLDMHGTGTGPAVYRLQGRGQETRPGCDRHPDPVAEAIRWGVCEAELLQAIGRGRGVNRDAETPLAVDLLTALPLPLRVDEAGAFETFEPTPADLMRARGVEVLDTSARGAWGLVAAILPDIFPTPDAARMAAVRLREHNPYSILIGLRSRNGSGAARIRLPGTRSGNVPLAIRAASETEAREIPARVIPGAELLEFEPPELPEAEQWAKTRREVAEIARQQGEAVADRVIREALARSVKESGPTPHAWLTARWWRESWWRDAVGVA